MMYTGFMTNQLSLKKAERKHIEGIVRLYGVNDSKEQRKIASKWQSIIDSSKDDYQEDVNFVVRNRRKRIIGLVRAKNVENGSLSVTIWLSTPERKQKYLEHLIESIVEYYEDYEKYEDLSEIKIIDKDFTSDCISVAS